MLVVANTFLEVRLESRRDERRSSSAPAFVAPQQEEAPETPRAAARPRAAPACLTGTVSKTTEDEATSEKVEAVIREARLGERTTLMLNNLPHVLWRDGLKNVLDAHGFSGQYDFIYMPVQFASGKSLGYAFVNFTSPDAAKRCWDALDGSRGWSRTKACTVAWCWPHQGLEAHVKLYRNSTLLHESIPDGFKPALYDDKGGRRAFPAPLRRIRMPRFRHWPRPRPRLLGTSFQNSCEHKL